MNKPTMIIIGILVVILGFLVIYSQQRGDVVAKSAQGHGAAGGGYGSAAPAAGGYGSSAGTPAAGGYGSTPAPASGGYGSPAAPAAGGYGAPAPAAGGYGK